MTATEPSFRWYQYSLRSLLVFVTLCAVPCSWVAAKMETARRQRDTVQAILKHDACEVAYDGDARDVFEPDPSLIEYAFTGKPPASPPPTARSERLFGKDFVRRAVTVGVPLAEFDDVEPYLANLPYLQKVCILMPDNDHDQELDAAIKRINQDVPGMDVRGVVFDFTLGTDESAQTKSTEDDKHGR